MKVKYLLILFLLAPIIGNGQKKVLYKIVGHSVMESSIFTENEFKLKCYSEKSNSIIRKGVSEKIENGEYLLSPVIKIIDTTVINPNNLSFTIELRYIKNVNGKSQVLTVSYDKTEYWGVKIIGRNKPGDSEKALWGEWAGRRVKLTWEKTKDNLYDYLLIDDAPQLDGGFTILLMPNMEMFQVR